VRDPGRVQERRQLGVEVLDALVGRQLGRPRLFALLAADIRDRLDADARRRRLAASMRTTAWLPAVCCSAIS